MRKLMEGYIATVHGKTLKDFFLESFDIVGNCWEWNKVLQKDGYGCFVSTDGKHYLAHRYSMILKHGIIPKGMQVLHKCDNRKCVNPDHLFFGTQADNVRDMDKKGRRGTTKGVSNKLKEEDVLRIRRIASSYKIRTEFSQPRLAKEYGVEQSTISSIVLNKSWKHLL